MYGLLINTLKYMYIISTHTYIYIGREIYTERERLVLIAFFLEIKSKEISKRLNEKELFLFVFIFYKPRI